MKRIFLEAHNLRNLNFGFGQFNKHLLQAISRVEQNDFEFVVHANNLDFLEKPSANFKLRKYHSYTKFPLLRIRKKYDLWHCLNQNIKIEPLSKLPYLLTVHNISHVENADNYKHLPAHVQFQEKLNRSTAITYISEYAKSSTHEFFDVPNVPEFVIYNGNPEAHATLPNGFRPRFIPDKPYLFTIGQISGRKNFASLVEMLTHVPDLQLVIAGKKDTDTGEKLAELIARKGLSHRVFLLGTISDNERHYYYQNCYGFVFPSLREGFGLPVVEAMGAGKPVFLSHNTSLPEVGGEVANYWFDYDAKTMADVLQQGLDEHYANQIENEARLIAQTKKFDWDVAASHYLDVYRKLLL